MMGRGGAAGAPGWATPGGGAGCGNPSASEKSRPSTILAPTKRKKFVVTTAERTCPGVPSSWRRMLRKVKTPARSWNVSFVPSRKSMKSSFEKGQSRTLRLRMSLAAMTSRSGSLYGRGRNRTALVTLKMAVLAPTPRAMVSAAVSAKIGLFRSVRPANASSRSAILPPHSSAAAAQRIAPPLPPMGFETLRQRLLWGCVTFPLKINPELDLSETHLLSRMVQAWGEIPLAFLQHVGIKKRLYGYIGMKDFTLHPFIPRGSLVQIDTATREFSPADGRPTLIGRSTSSNFAKDSPAGGARW